MRIRFALTEDIKHSYLNFENHYSNNKITQA